MKKERNEFLLLIRELLILAVEIVFAAGVILGAMYVVGFIVESISGIVSIGVGMLILFILGGLLFFADLRPDCDTLDSRKEYLHESRQVKAISNKSRKAYSVR